jgi:two-component system cell cycle response regulator
MMMAGDDKAEAPPETEKPLRLLLAEDEPVQRLLFRRTLEKSGYQVEAVSSGEAALEKVMGGGFHLLLTDWDMPGMDGAELCRRIRKAKLKEYVYILMVTSHSSVSDMVFAIKAGANDFIRKPLDQAELLARLMSASELVLVQRDLRAANAQIERMSCIDVQLRCYNKGYLNDHLPRAVAHAIRHQEPLSLIMADLDAFKTINDTYGHMAADEVLSGFVERANRSLRSSDWIARFGGEEFAIILPATALEPARGVAEKLRAGCADEAFKTSAGSLTVTVSLGVASFAPSSNEISVNDLLSRADAALYRSKKEGRNRVSVSGEGTSE